MKIGEKIKQRRLELGWSQRDLAAKMDYLNHSTIGRIESGSVDIPQSKIVMFSQVLGVSIAYLMDWEDKSKEQSTQNDRLSEKRKMLMDFVMSVPDDKAEMLLRVMKSIVEAD